MTKIFVYGTLKKGHSNHNLLLSSPYIKQALTKPEFTMVRLGFFPGILANGNTAIHGEVYSASDQVLLQLDKLENHSYTFERTPIFLADGDYVHTYIYKHKDRAQGIIETGIWWDLPRLP